MANLGLTPTDERRIEKAVSFFEENTWNFETTARNVVDILSSHPQLRTHIHFINSRVKDPGHLRDKLARKTRDRKKLIQKGRKRLPPEITADNLFRQVNDLAGVRLIHLHTEQFSEIHEQLLQVFADQEYRVIELEASCWDAEYRDIYHALGIPTRETEGYSSVHYIIEVNRKTGMTCEIQVRTLTDEVWGEVSHGVNYPDESPSELCQKQLKTLARLTTGATRLVDSIFEIDKTARAVRRRPARKA